MNKLDIRLRPKYRNINVVTSFRKYVTHLVIHYVSAISINEYRLHNYSAIFPSDHRRWDTPLGTIRF